jgi:hypothetical protein
MSELKAHNMVTPRKRNYINNPDLYAELKKFWDDKQAGKDPRISNYIGEAILLMATRILTRPNFSGYSQQWKEEMKSDGIRNSVIGVNTFNPNKSTNPFGFFSRVIWNAYIHRIKLEKKQNAIKHKNRQNLDFGEGDIPDDEVSNQIIEAFEKSLLTAKLKADTILKNKQAANPKKVVAKAKK